VDIKKYEKMVKLDLPEYESETIAGQAEKMLGSFSVLDNINTDGFEPLVSVLEGQNKLREDIALKNTSELLSNAPEQYGGYFQIPKTVV
jgi:aspartyl-tRNA(Asn)/glutamyl-tRNA(Gln) amidotransferase subunit C